MLLGIIVTLEAQILFYEFNSANKSNKKSIINQLQKILLDNVDSTNSKAIIERRQTSNSAIISLNENDVNIMDSFNNIRNIENKQLFLHYIQPCELLKIFTLYTAESIDDAIASMPHSIPDVFYNKIKSYFTEENIENIPLYIIQIRCKSIYQSLVSKQNCCQFFDICCIKQKHSMLTELEIKYNAITEMVELNNIIEEQPLQESDDIKEQVVKTTPLLLPDRVRKKKIGFADQRRLEKQLHIQKELELELQNLNAAGDPVDAAKRIIEFVRNSGEDPLVGYDNPLASNAAMGFGFPTINISTPDFYTRINDKYNEWSKTRQLIDNIFTDLENLFYLLSKLIVRYDPFLDEDIVSVYDYSKLQYYLLTMVFVLINIVIYVLIVVITLVIVLPSCFFLLIVRMTKVEIDTKDLEHREGILIQENCCQRFCRLIAQFIRAMFVFAFLVIYPIIIVNNIIPGADGLNSNKDYVSIICISTYLFVILGLQLFGTVRAIKSFHQRKKMTTGDNINYKSKYLFQQKQFHWTIGSVIGIIFMFYEVFQLIMFTYQSIDDSKIDNESDNNTRLSADSVGINSDAMLKFSNFIINVCYISIDAIEDNILEFYMVFSLFCVSLLLIIFVCRFLYELREYGKRKYIAIDENENVNAHTFYFHSFIGTIVYGHGTLKNVNRFTSKIVSILSDVLFIVICQKIILILSCNNGHLRIDNEQQCWVGKHYYYSIISLILLGYYIPICVMISPMFAETVYSSDANEEDSLENEKPKQGICGCCKRGKKDNEIKKEKEKLSFWSFTNTIHFVSPYLSTLTLSECFMLITSQFVSKGHLFGLIISQVIIMVFLLIFTFKWSLHNLYLYGLTNNEPAFPFSASIIRSFGYICGIFACFIQIFYYVNVVDYVLSLLFTWISVIFISIFTLILFYKYYSIYYYYQPNNQEENNDDKMQQIMLNYNKDTDVMKLMSFP